MASASLEFQRVVFYYDAAGGPVFDDLNVRFPQGWTGVIGPNGSSTRFISSRPQAIIVGCSSFALFIILPVLDSLLSEKSSTNFL